MAPAASGAGPFRRRWLVPGLIAGLVCGMCAGVALGPVPIPLSELAAMVGASWGGAGEAVAPAHALIVQHIRLPRVICAALVGAILAMSGMVMQGLFQNPLASPYLLGIASGASVGAALVIVFGAQQALGGMALPLGAFAGGAAAVWAVYRLAHARGGRRDGTTLILAGVALGALFSAITTFLIVLSGEQMREIVFWVMGSLGRARWEHTLWLAPLAALGGGVLLVHMRELNALSLGEMGARRLGLRPETLSRVLLTVVTLMASVAVAVAGTIGFVGLITPHAMRLLVGPDQRVLLPVSALAGALFLVLADTAARTALAPLELPVGILTAFMGAPFFLFLLLRPAEGRPA